MNYILEAIYNSHIHLIKGTGSYIFINIAGTGL